MWVDDKGRVRKLHYDVPGDAGSVTMELYDFGVAVDATPPPADQVADLGALLGRSG